MKGFGGGSFGLGCFFVLRPSLLLFGLLLGVFAVGVDAVVLFGRANLFDLLFGLFGSSLRLAHLAKRGRHLQALS